MKKQISDWLRKTTALTNCTNVSTQCLHLLKSKRCENDKSWQIFEVKLNYKWFKVFFFLIWLQVAFIHSIHIIMFLSLIQPATPRYNLKSIFSPCCSVDGSRSAFLEPSSPFSHPFPLEIAFFIQNMSNLCIILLMQMHASS